MRDIGRKESSAIMLMLCPSSYTLIVGFMGEEANCII